MINITLFLIYINFLLDYFFRDGKKSKSIVFSKDDKNSTLLIILAYAIVLILNDFFAKNDIGKIDNIFLAQIGFVGMIGAMVFRIFSMRTLKSSYSRTLYSQGKLITHGIYKFVRHPGYLGSIFIWIFFSFGQQNIFTFLVIIIILIPVYMYRIKVEEQMLEKSFGKDYKVYQKNSFKLIPKIW